MTRTCIDCGTAVSTKSTGRCRSCATTRKNKSDKHRAAMREHFLKLNARPGFRALGPAVRTGWCPPEYQVLNRNLSKARVPLDERKAIILAEVPGTVEHARRQIASFNIAQRLRVEREQRDAY